MFAKRLDTRRRRRENHALSRLQANDARIAVGIDLGKLTIVSLPCVDRLHGNVRQLAVGKPYETVVGEENHAFAAESHGAESDQAAVAANDRPRRAVAGRPGRVQRDPPQPIDLHGDRFLRGLAEVLRREHQHLGAGIGPDWVNAAA